MTEDYALYDARDLYMGDPLKPDMEVVTPGEIIATLTKPEREARVRWLINQAFQIIEDALEAHGGGKTIVAKCVLFSGGNDSTVLGHLMKSYVTHAVHANTTIGIE